MASENENEFLNQWRDVFDKAEMQPPDNLWDRIEDELDKDEKKTVFIWWKNPFLISGIAASLLLMLSWVVLKNQSVDIQENSSEEAQVATTKVLPSGNDLREKSSKNNENTKNLAILSEKSQTKVSKAKNNNRSVGVQSSGLAMYKNQNEWSRIAVQEPSQQAIKTQATEPVATQSVIASLDPTTNVNQENETIDKIKTIDFELYNSRFTFNRKKLFVDFPIEEQEVVAKNDKATWFGIQSGIAPFNPNFQSDGFSTLALSESKKFVSDDSNYEVQVEPPVGVNGGGTGIAELPSGDKSFNVASSQPIQRFNSGRAINVGFRVGKQLSKRIAFESGLRYLQGNSTFNTNVYSFNNQTGEAKSFFANYLDPNLSLNNTIIASEQQLSNNYDFLMLPLQLVYQIPIANKFQADVVAGFSTDILLTNTIAGVKSTFDFSEEKTSLYRNFNMSGLAGVRINYLFTPKWQISFGGNWQQSAFSTLKPNAANISIRPHLMGLTYGLNYRF